MISPELPPTLRHLARLLETRRQARTRPYHLLLTSALSLTPDVLRSICGTDDWSTFRTFMQRLSPYERSQFLAPPILRATQHRAGYQALARLIARGYFATILTTSIDSALEDALIEAKVFTSQTLIPGRDINEHIKRVLNDFAHTPRIVKLHGSLRDDIVPDRFPDFFELKREISESVSRYLNQDIVIVGSLEHEYDIERVIMWDSQERIYYVHEQETLYEDTISKIMRERGSDPEHHVIAGPYGNFDLFFPTLETLLASDTPARSPSSPAIKLPKHSPEETRTQTVPGEQNRADILLVTVTEIETRAIFAALDMKVYERCTIGDKTYYKLGIINGARVYLVQSEMGISGSGGALLTVSEGIRALSPSAIVMVGIAFGFDQNKQRIGDVLVSVQLRAYEQQRHGSRSDGTSLLIARGNRVPASDRLIDRFRSGYMDWPKRRARITFGLILSGEKLVDNKDFRNWLLTLEPEAVGGEMEGAGLYAVAQRYKVDWILVKAICDWADGNKAQDKLRNQRKAARNAAMFTLHVLQHVQF